MWCAKSRLFFVVHQSTASPLEDSLHSETTEPDAYWALSNWVIKRDEASVAQPESDASAEPDAYWALSNWVIKREPCAEVVSKRSYHV